MYVIWIVFSLIFTCSEFVSTLSTDTTSSHVEINVSTKFHLINIFGRLAEKKSLGYTSAYNGYMPTPLSLWLPNRWSRRLRVGVNDPEWRRLFDVGTRSTSTGDDIVITEDQFISQVQKFDFMFPIECTLPLELPRLLERQNSPADVTQRARDLIDQKATTAQTEKFLRADEPLRREIVVS